MTIVFKDNARKQQINTIYNCVSPEFRSQRRKKKFCSNSTNYLLKQWQLKRNKIVRPCNYTRPKAIIIIAVIRKNRRC
jgi:hypothetical protein